METLNVLQISYESVLSYRENENDGNLRRKDGRRSKLKEVGRTVYWMVSSLQWMTWQELLVGVCEKTEKLALHKIGRTF